ncbi:hypothetical protein SeMB42_g01255, partial [Synchytrium endobioticum]
MKGVFVSLLLVVAIARAGVVPEVDESTLSANTNKTIFDKEQCVDSKNRSIQCRQPSNRSDEFNVTYFVEDSKELIQDLGDLLKEGLLLATTKQGSIEQIIKVIEGGLVVGEDVGVLIDDGLQASRDLKKWFDKWEAMQGTTGGTVTSHVNGTSVVVVEDTVSDEVKK